MAGSRIVWAHYFWVCHWILCYEKCIIIKDRIKGETMEFDHLRNEIIESNTIANQMYDELNVKRGLRNSDGSGVLAGLSRISSVIG